MPNQLEARFAREFLVALVNCWNPTFFSFWKRKKSSLLLVGLKYWRSLVEWVMLRMRKMLTALEQCLAHSTCEEDTQHMPSSPPPSQQQINWRRLWKKRDLQPTSWTGCYKSHSWLCATGSYDCAEMHHLSSYCKYMGLDDCTDHQSCCRSRGSTQSKTKRLPQPSRPRNPSPSRTRIIPAVVLWALCAFVRLCVHV